MSAVNSPLSRTSSSNSICSIDGLTSTTRRTRKRFTNVQLTMLENLFHQNSHPSREDREAVAKSGGMEVKSVTIWFQNKRQTERKVALQNAISGVSHANPLPMLSSAPQRRSLPHAYSDPSTSPTSTHSALSTKSRPSLDRVASRSEMRSSGPRTPSRRHNPNASLWDNMPSSPIGPPASPPPHERDYVNFRQPNSSRRTLEWACAAARLAGKDAANDEDLTDDEADEAITPQGTWSSGDKRWGMEPGSIHGNPILRKATLPQDAPPEDDDTMRAALALCGLGRRGGP